MSDQFHYTENNSIIIQDGNMIWNDNSHDQSSLQFMDANDTVITDSIINESYVTAIDANETQYLSILESSNDITLEHLNLRDPEAQGNIVFSENALEINNDESDSNSQVVVFTVDGSDDLYGLQFTQDKEGNLQKYQFKFRTTSYGDLEAIPESIELLARDESTAIETEREDLDIAAKEIEDSQTQEYFLIQPQIDQENLNDNNKEQVITYQEMFEKGGTVSSIILQEHLENSPKELHEHSENFVQQQEEETMLQSININVKKESIVHESGGIPSETEYLQEDIFSEVVHNPELLYNKDPENISIKQMPQEDIHNHNINIKEELDISDNNVGNEIVGNLGTHQVVQSFVDEKQHIQLQSEPEELVSSTQNFHFKEIYNTAENEKEYANDYLEETILGVENDESDDEYEITKEFHVTGEHDVHLESENEEVVEREPELTVENNILKHPIVNSEKDIKSKRPFVSVKYYVVYPEKENVNSLGGNIHSQLPVPKLTKSNPRSVLRTSFIKPREPVKCGKISTNEFPESDLFHKRFAKSKEAMQAKLFHNFINRTTIPQAPIRHTRQPRKQEIKPVTERRDEEIIVQEVMISSNGLIENLNRKLKNKKLQVTAVVELSDSEDEPISNANIKPNEVPRTRPEREISVIEIGSDEEQSSIRNKVITDAIQVKRSKGRPRKYSTSSRELSPLKGRRGRPPKNRLNLEEAIDIGISSSKRNRVERVEFQSDNLLLTNLSKDTVHLEKQEIACPSCSKTFPSQNSLNTHLIHHNLENSLKNKKAKMNDKSIINSCNSVVPIIEYNHKCDVCQQNFKNNILLQRHDCSKKQSVFNCSVCLKQFRDVTMLNIHKKSHIKSNLVKNTSVLKVSPKKVLHKSRLIKSPKAKLLQKAAINSFKCRNCPKICDSVTSLATHSKIHKKFSCLSCSASFSSRILLDTHIRIDCVKFKSPAKRRLSFKVKRSFAEPRSKETVTNLANKNLNSTLNQSMTSFKLECDICKVTFSTYRNLYIHKVENHGLNTPDKSLLTKPKQGLYKPKAPHGGIPANDRLKKAYTALRRKLAENQEQSSVV